MTNLRVGTLNIPLDPAKLPDGPKRAVEAAKQINASNLAIVALQELDRGKYGTDHAYATQLLNALGKGWKLVQPTTRWNENYLAYRPAVVTLKQSLGDAILTSSSGGRHATRAVFAVGGQEFKVFSTHLVSGSGSARQLAREEQGRQLAALADSYTLILGDLNQKAVPKALAASHATTRVTAKDSTNAKYGTHAKYSATKPSTSSSAILDHVLPPKPWGVNGHTLVGISGGKFTQPRISDHVLVIAALSIPITLKRDIKSLQIRLNSLGFRVGKEDGIDGPRTQDGVKRFQLAWNLGKALVPDSIAGAKTLAAMAQSEANGNRISPHFKTSEIRCKCNGTYSRCLGVLAYRADLAGLETLRSRAYKSGLRIVSAYRCPDHNRAVGGASASQHLVGRAYDIPAVLPVGSLKIPLRFRGQGYQRATRKVRHIDSRAKKTQWTY